MHDAVRSAYATLGLEPHAPLRRVRSQYKALVRRWHPDRFAGDAQGVAEATLRMRAINDAFATIVRSSGPGEKSGMPAGSTAVGDEGRSGFGRPLSREEIDEIVGAIRPPLNVYGWLADDPWNHGLPIALVLIEAIVAGWHGWRHPYDRFTPIPPVNAMLGDASAVLLLGFIFVAMIGFDFDPTRIGWGGQSLGGPAKIVGWAGIVLLTVVSVASILK